MDYMSATGNKSSPQDISLSTAIPNLERYFVKVELSFSRHSAFTYSICLTLVPIFLSLPQFVLTQLAITTIKTAAKMKGNNLRNSLFYYRLSQPKLEISK